MVVFDAAVLTLLLWDGAEPPADPATGKKVERCKERMELLVQTLHASRTVIIVPTPALSEVLVVTGASGLKYVQILQKSIAFKVLPFDTLAAIELAVINRAALDEGDKKSGADAPWQKIKVDRQIVAIGKVAGAQTIYTNDKTLGGFAAKAGMQVIGVHELPMPPEASQADLFKELEAKSASGATQDEPKPDEIEDDESEAESESDEGGEQSSEPKVP